MSKMNNIGLKSNIRNTIYDKV